MPTGDAPTTYEWLTILLPTKTRLYWKFDGACPIDLRLIATIWATLNKEVPEGTDMLASSESRSNHVVQAYKIGVKYPMKKAPSE